MYDHKRIEKKWQKFWEENQSFYFNDEKDGQQKPKFYALDMFPYPSGDGLHMGHPRGYIATDIWSRYKRANGFNVLHTMGWDAFGLPAENYAIKTGIHPNITTQKSIANFTKQLKSIGFSFDWSREINTSSEDYYKWTQWIFIKLFNSGLAYQKEAPVNWCPSCQTVLANEQVNNGLCERCGSEVRQKLLKQWFFKITDYADELLDDLKNLDWPEKIKLMQENWIGKSQGARIDFAIKGSDQKIEVFTTRPDTLFGATYLVLAPEHPILEKLKLQTTNSKEIEQYQQSAAKKTELERKIEEKTKTGIELQGVSATHPITGAQLPIWVADYVLTGYGTGAIMAVPAHDERDFDFAQTFNLPIVEVVEKPKNTSLPYVGDGKLINSKDWNDKQAPSEINEIIEWLEVNNLGKKETNYRLRDWLVSRQRYWGPPIPIIHCDDCGAVAVPESDLPVKLPEDVDFKPTGESPLKSSQSFNEGVTCPNCNKPARREFDTLDTFVDSSWYFLRYTDPKNNNTAFDKNIVQKLMPVDLYVGGAEHAVLHLLYSRFMMKALADILSLNVREPFKKLRNQGLVLAGDGRKMSKSLGNVINPDEVVEQYGADTLRTYQMFMGPFDDAIPWSSKSILGIRRFLDKVYDIVEKTKEDFQDDSSTITILNKTINKVTSDIEEFKFNTAISTLMIATNHFKTLEYISTETFSKFLQILNPFAPHLSQELWTKIGNKDTVEFAVWPQVTKIKDEEVNLVVQVNGKTKGIVKISTGISEDEVVKILELQEKFKPIFSENIKKIIFIKDKIINFVL